MPRVTRSEAEIEARRDAPETIESLERGLRLLQRFGDAPSPASLSDLARVAELPRATARRILQTLVAMGLVASDGKLFSLTPRVLALAGAYLASSQVVAVLQPMMDRVATEAQEVCSLAILDGRDAVFVARASPARVFSAGIDIGYRLPAFCTSVGRALLGRLDDAALAAFLAESELVAMTPFTLTDPTAVQAAVAAGRAQGHCLVDREAEPGFRSLSVPVRRYDGTIVAAVNIGAHIDRISNDEMIARFLPILQAELAGVSVLLL